MIISRNKLTFSFLLALTIVFVQLLLFIPRVEAGSLTVDSFNPPDDSVGVAVDANLAIDFSAYWDVNMFSGSVTIYQSNGSVFESYFFPGGSVPAGITGAVSSDILTINPSASFKPSSSYYVNFDANIVEEDGPFGIYYAGINDATTWNFTTGADTSPPTVVTFTPPDNSTNINADTNLVINFNEIVVVGTGNVYIRRISDNATVHTINITSGLVTGSGTSTLTINPSTNLSSMTAYYVEIDATAIDDNYGNSFAGISGNSTWNFTIKEIFDPNGWSDYISVTIDSSQLNGDLTNYPIFIDLSHFNGTNFFAVVKNDGADIRITKTDNATLLAREIVVIDTANGAGELHFLANGTLSSSVDTTFHIFYGNGSASEPAADDEFGSENVWANNFSGIWHMSDAPTNSVASVFDSTANHNHAIPQIGTGTMTLAPGRVGLGTYLGDNAFLMIPASSTMYPTHLSGTVFSKPDRLYRDANMNNSSNIVFNKGTGTAYDGYGLGLNPVGGSTVGGATTNGRLLYVTAVGKGWDDGKYDIIFSTIASQPATSWNITQSTYSDTSGLYNLFQFGLVDNGKITTGDISATNVSSAIGQSPTWRDHDEFFRGIIDEVRYSSTDRSVNWTSTEYTNLTCPYLIYSVNGVRPDEYYTLTRGALFPVDNATGVSTTGLTLTITYNKEVYPFKGNFYLRRSSDNSILETIPTNHLTKISGYGTNTLSIALSSTLDAATSYYVNFDSQAIVDFCGQVAAPISNNSSWNFTTTGGGSLTLISSVPADNAVGVSPTIGLSLTFNATMGAPGAGFYEIICDGPPFCPNVGLRDCSDFSGSGTDTMSRAYTYLPNKNYHIEWDGNCFQDVNGTFLAANSSSTYLNFSTGAADTTPPNCTVSLSPPDNATGVLVNTNLVLSCDENVDAETGNIYIRRISDNIAIHTIAVGSGLVTGSGTNTITINPSSDLAYSTAYYVEIDATAFDDAAGNSFAGISGNSTWNFTTEYSAGWLSSEWLNRIKITINSSHVNGNLSNFPVYLDLSDLPAGFFSGVQNNGSDIRITLADGLTMLPVEVVSINTISSNGEMYFKAPSLSSTANTEFYIYYNNPNVSMKNGADVLGSQNVWSNNYIAVYHLQQLPGQGNALISDSTANRNHLIPNGSMTNTDLEVGKLGSSINFDGTNDFLSASDSVSLDSASGVGQARTISYWLKTTDSANKVILEKGTNQNFVEQIHTNQAIARTNSTTYATSTTTISNNIWHFVTHTYSGTTNYVFVDSGSFEDDQVEVAPASNNDPLVIGARANSSFAYQGNLDEIRISSIERTANWINTEFKNQNSPNTFYNISTQEGVNDNSNPKVSSLYPSTQSIQHPIRHPLKMIFNEVINLGNGNINIHNYSNDVIFETIDINNVIQVNGNGTNTLRFTTNSNLIENTKYYVLIDFGAIRDGATNQYSSIWNKDTWVFTTQGKDSIKKHQIFILDGN